MVLETSALLPEDDEDEGGWLGGGWNAGRRMRGRRGETRGRNVASGIFGGEVGGVRGDGSVEG